MHCDCPFRIKTSSVYGDTSRRSLPTRTSPGSSSLSDGERESSVVYLSRTFLLVLPIYVPVDGSESGRTVQSSSLTIDTVDALVELWGRVTEITEYIDVSKAAVSNHCHTLRRKGFVVPRGDGFYPSLKFAHVGEHAKRHDRAYELAAEATRELDEAIPFRTTFIVEENCIGRYPTSEVNQSGKHDRFAFTGEELHLHTLAAGKTILASFPVNALSGYSTDGVSPRKRRARSPTETSYSGN